MKSTNKALYLNEMVLAEGQFEHLIEYLGLPKDTTLVVVLNFEFEYTTQSDVDKKKNKD